MARAARRKTATCGELILQAEFTAAKEELNRVSGDNEPLPITVWV